MDISISLLLPSLLTGGFSIFFSVWVTKSVMPIRFEKVGARGVWFGMISVFVLCVVSAILSGGSYKLVIITALFLIAAVSVFFSIIGLPLFVLLSGFSKVRGLLFCTLSSTLIVIWNLFHHLSIGPDIEDAKVRFARGLPALLSFCVPALVSFSIGAWLSKVLRPKN
jgi:hypothetical protein